MTTFALFGVILLCTINRHLETQLLQAFLEPLSPICNYPTTFKFAAVTLLLICKYYHFAILSVMGFCIEVLLKPQGECLTTQEFFAIFLLSLMFLLLVTSLAIHFLQARDRMAASVVEQDMRNNRLSRQESLQKFIERAELGLLP